MKRFFKLCAILVVASSILFSLASCKSEDDDSSPVAVTSVELSETTATITVGGTKTLTATVKPDNATDKTVTWTSDKTEVATVENGVVTAKKAGTATITAKAGDKTATCAVTVSEVTYTVTVTSGTANPTTAAAGATVTITANDPAEGKVFDKWTTGTTGVTFTDESASSTTFTMPASAVTITATYKDVPAQTYAVTVTSGTANPTTAAAGATVTITANDPAEGKVFDKWTTETTGVTFTDESASSTTFTMPASAVTITATYKDAPTYSVTIAESTSGTVTASKTSGILQNETITLTVTPDSGYKLNTIGAKTGETDITITNNTFVMPAGNVTVTATFEAASYSITLNVNGGAYAESYSAPTSYTYGTGATLPTSENITKTNYAFGGWFASSDFSGDAVTAISTTDIGNKEYWAKWIPIYAVTVTNGTANPTTAAAGATVTITASDPAEGKVFNKWTTETTGVTFADESASSTTFTMPASAVTITATYKDVPWDGDLSKLTAQSTEAYATATDGMTLTGTLAVNVKVSIADGATVTLNGVTIEGESDYNLRYAGITCQGNATVLLADSTSNTLKGFSPNYPGIYVPVDKTLTIKGKTAGTGVLNASSNGRGAGIGGGYGTTLHCGNIVIEGGVIIATGGDEAAGIGASWGATNGTITISGGTVTATGGNGASGIGSGHYGSSGNITIADTVTKVTATKGDKITYIPETYRSIGMGEKGTCGTVTIGGTIYADGITESPYTYPKIVDLSKITSNTVIQDGYTVIGSITQTSSNNRKIQIAAGATVTLKNVNIKAEKKVHGIQCLGDATIILEGDNTINATSQHLVALLPGGAGTTLTIKGDGKLTAKSYSSAAAIGSSSNISSNPYEGKVCGNITIESGTIIATCQKGGAGIGTGVQGTCGNIIISGGTVEATGGDENGSSGAGIGTGRRLADADSVCGDITISGENTKVIAKSTNADSIGRGSPGSKLNSAGTNYIYYPSTIGTVTIGGETGAKTAHEYTYNPSGR